MYFEFLVEDLSGKALIDTIMRKIKDKHPDVDYRCKSFGGIGGYKKHGKATSAKTGKLLNDLPHYLCGFNKSLKNNPDTTVFIVLDNDTRNVEEFRSLLQNISLENLITIDHVYCIAIEETEAWLLGDEAAIKAAYPRAKLPVLRSYVQDSICNTWEKLADVVYPGGFNRMKKDCTTYAEIGRMKSEWAEKIGLYMDLECNRSPSFNFFIGELNKRIISTQPQVKSG